MTGPIARAPFGTVRGVEKDGVASFRGIPFGASTAGGGRWKRSRPWEPTADELDATAFGPACPQNTGGMEALLGGDEAGNSEDCLRLNVFTPASDDGHRPVMVWIHGGAFVSGSGHVAWYNGTSLARRDTVVVTINYRLGALGYLNLEGLGLGDAFPDTGNLGLLDQIDALRWVRDNITAFGGDPANVTIFGESAGAMSIGTLLGAPEARGLFHKAVLQSGAAEHLRDREQATAVAEQFVEAAGTGADAERLASLDVAAVLEAQAKVGMDGVAVDLAMPWEPMVDGRHVPERPLDQVVRGELADVPMMVGTTLEEMRLFQLLVPALGQMDDDKLLRWFTRAFGTADAATQAIEVYRLRLGASTPAPSVWAAGATDAVFRMPAVRLAERQSAHQAQTFMYLFAYRSPAFGGMLGSSHALEIPFVFDNLDAGGVAMFTGPIEPPLRSLAKAMADAWAAFAHTGTPAAADLPGWAPYETAGRSTMWLDVGLSESVSDPMSDERQLWPDTPAR